METIKVNMSPNPLDVQTIHASQGDTEAREWEFELHNNGDVIDASEISDQLAFKAYKGGTEQLLPENTNTPTTSPFLGDIKYPQGLLTDQEFTYRQSPTESDGLAKITDIKGNTIVWNQLVQNGNFADDSGWQALSDATFTVSSNICTMVLPTNDSNVRRNVKMTNGHKYLLSSALKVTGQAFVSIAGVGATYFDSTSFETKNTIFSWGATTGPWALYIRNNSGASNNVQAKNIMLFDLTTMGLDSITDPSDFASLFPLSYYSYNQGSLLSFNGTGLKITGKNLLNYDIWKTVETRNGTSVWENNGVTITATANDAYTLYGESTFPVNARIPVRVGERITLSWESDDNVNGDVYIFPNGTSAGFVKINNRLGRSLSYTPIDEVEYVTIRFGVASSGNTIHFKNIMVRFADTDDTFEPYTSSTLSLPISTYFPNGMKSAGSVYDELTETKAITRVGAVDLGSLDGYNYATSSGVNYFFSNSFPVPAQAQGEMSNIKSSLYTPKTVMGTIGQGLTENMTMVVSATGYVCFRNDDITSATAFKSAMSGVYLYYELKTPTETSSTTASLVTENAEIPLSNNDGVLVGKCTEQLSENPGFIDAKIKLADADGECYSNKIQLHVERSPK